MSTVFNNQRTASLLTVLVLTAILVAMEWLGVTPVLLLWLLVLSALTVFTIECGRSVTGRWLGALIDERNVISLSRFQIVLWTLLLMSAFLSAALYNMLVHLPSPLNITIQQELWWLMGISTASLIGSPLILNTKTGKTNDTTEVSKTFELLEKQGDEADTLATKGHVLINTDIAKARWSDMFTGEEVGNAAHLDVARLQMFFITLVTVLAYAVALGRLFASQPSQGIPILPELSGSMIALIAISHTGYLAAKAVPRSQSGTAQTDTKLNHAADETDDQPAMG